MKIIVRTYSEAIPKPMDDDEQVFSSLDEMKEYFQTKVDTAQGRNLAYEVDIEF